MVVVLRRWLARIRSGAPGPVPVLKPLHFWVSLPLNADNTYQGLDLKVDFTVYAVQKRSNP